jgi:SulP family sulfate permease
VAAAIKGGKLTRFVSEPVLIGFTAGAGIYIAVNQLPSALGIPRKEVTETLWGWTPPADVLFDFLRTLSSAGKANFIAVGVVLATVGLVRLCNWLDAKYEKRLPATFLTVAVVSLAAYLLGLGDPAAGHSKLRLVQDIEPVKRALPSIVLPDLDLNRMLALIGPAFAIGILGAVEAIAIAKSLAAQAGHRFDANRQLVGEGMCNIGASLVGGFAASGSFTRTAVNHEAGAVTRLSAIFSGLLITLIVMLFAPVANYIPVAVLAGLLIHIGLRLVNLGRVRLVVQTSGSDRAVLISTCVAVLLLPSLAQALFLGVGLSIVFALRRAEGFRLRVLEEDPDGNLVEGKLNEELPQVIALDLQGELFFAAAEELDQQLRSYFSLHTRYVVLRLQQAYNMDLTCGETIRHIARDAEQKGCRLLLSGVRPGTMRMLERAGIVDAIGRDYVFPAEATVLGSTHHALRKARELAATDPLLSPTDPAIHT